MPIGRGKLRNNLKTSPPPHTQDRRLKGGRRGEEEEKKGAKERKPRPLFDFQIAAYAAKEGVIFSLQ